MTLDECKKRKREYIRMLKNLELIQLSLVRSIGIEDMNIAELKKKARNEE